MFCYVRFCWVNYLVKWSLNWCKSPYVFSHGFSSQCKLVLLPVWGRNWKTKSWRCESADGAWGSLCVTHKIEPLNLPFAIHDGSTTTVFVYRMAGYWRKYNTNETIVRSFSFIVTNIWTSRTISLYDQIVDWHCLFKHYFPGTLSHDHIDQVSIFSGLKIRRA